MSRIGNKPIALPKGVSIDASGERVQIKGPKGSLGCTVVPGISVAQDAGAIHVRRSGDSPQDRADHGLVWALVRNMVLGVSKGFERRLEIVGIGYKAEARGNKVVLSLGYSHPVEYPFPEGISITVEKNSKMVVSGIDKERVGQVASELRSFRPPDSYKGKGVRYEGEHVRIKAGKSGQ